MAEWVIVAVENEPRIVPPGDLLDLTATMGLLEVKLCDIARMYAVCEREKQFSSTCSKSGTEETPRGERLQIPEQARGKNGRIEVNNFKHS